MSIKKHRRPTLKGRVVLLWLATMATTAQADVTFPLYLSAGTYYQSDGETANTFQAVAASAEILLSSPVSPWSTGLFVGRVYSQDSEQDGAVFAGGLVEHQISVWDTTVSLINYDPPGDTGQWKYFGRVRYRFADSHKLGVEVIGSLRDPSTPNLMVGYYGTISDSLSLNVAAGPVAGKSDDFSARLELIWQIL